MSISASDADAIFGAGACLVSAVDSTELAGATTMAPRRLGRIDGRRGGCLGRGNRGNGSHHTLDPRGARAEGRAAAREQSFEGLLGVTHGLERAAAVEGCEPLEQRHDVAGNWCRRRSTEPVLHQRQQAAQTMRVFLLVNRAARAATARPSRPAWAKSVCMSNRTVPAAGGVGTRHSRHNW